MKRFSFTLALAIVFSLISSAVSVAQPAIDSGLTLDNLILRVASDGSWAEGVNPDGTFATREVIQVLDGVPQLEISPSAAALYQKHQTQHVYFYATAFDEMPLKDEFVSTGIEMRILVFPDEVNAEGYLAESFQAQVDAETDGDAVNAQFGAIDPLPSSEHPLTGWTFAHDYFNVTTDGFTGYASSARYMAQVGRVIVSARVSGPFVDFNFDLAYGLLDRQANCLMQPAPCQAVTITDAAAPGWSIQADGLGFTDVTGNRTPARVLFPIEEPVRAPEVSNFAVTGTPGSESAGLSSAGVTDAPADVPAGERTGVILLSLGPVRSEPLLKSEYVDNVMHGDAVKITGEPEEADGGTWIQIITPAGIPGWVPIEWVQED